MRLASPASAGLQATCLPCPDPAALAGEWEDLTLRSDGHFFTTWAWIGSWLTALPPERRPWLLRVSAADPAARTLGLALLGRQTVRRHGFVRSRGLFLNATGDEVLDDITIEYNQPLLDRDHAAPVLQAMFDHLLDAAAGWDELSLPGLHLPPGRGLEQGLEQGARAAGWRVLVDEKRSHRLDLDRVRQAGGITQRLSQRLRYRLRKTSRACTALGPLHMEAASSTTQAHDFLDQLIALHQPYWQQRGQPGAFATAFARDFHHRLVVAALARGQLQLLHIRAGTQTVGWLYNFVRNGHVYSYQSAFAHQALPASVSPGQLCHALAIDACAQAGLQVYDFMAGDHRYKRELASDSLAMRWVVLQQARLDLRVEAALRRLKQQWRSLRTSRRGSEPA